MTYSVRNLVIVTTYSALMLSKSIHITILVFAASASALFFIALVFGLTTLKAIANVDKSGRLLQASSPLALMIILWTALAVLSQYLFDSQPARINSVLISMILGLAAASIPMLVNMETRQQELDDRALWIGYWSLIASMTTAGIFSVVLHIILKQLNQSMDNDVYRWSSICGMIASVFTSWWLFKDPVT